MKSLALRLRQLLVVEEGVTTMEYAVIMALMAIVGLTTYAALSAPDGLHRCQVVGQAASS